MSDTLEGALADSLALLAEGAAEPGSPWRNLALGSVGPDGAPQVRTVVLRRFDPDSRALDVHTDLRSAKHAELAAHPAACLHGWDAGRQVQLRACGQVTLHTGDAIAEAAWSALHGGSRTTYRVSPGPGTALPDPCAVAATDEAAGHAVFCVVRLAMVRLEWLHLAQGSHRRARFDWAHAACTSMWLVP